MLCFAMPSKSRPDFRSVRKLLPPEAFALSEGMDVPPTELVDQATWKGIVHLPDDVALRTSDHSGTRLKLLYSLWGDWVATIGDPDQQDEIFTSLLDAADCFQSSHFNFLHGFYRTALAELRTALELVMIGAFGQLASSDQKYQEWKKGQSERFGFTKARKRLRILLGDRAPSLLMDGAAMAECFGTLCAFTHSRPDSSDGVLWNSNGPVYSHSAMLLVFKHILSVYAFCDLLVRIARPRFSLPEDSEILFELDWMPHHEALIGAHCQLFGKPPKNPSE
jgi:hypothetical protein